MSSSEDVEAGKSNASLGFQTKKNQSFYDSKLFRIISVIMYVCLVSGIGFLFALYHFFFWDSTMPPVAKIPGHEIY